MRVILNVIHGNNKSTQLFNDVKTIRFDSQYTAKLMIDGYEFEVEHPKVMFAYKTQVFYIPDKCEKDVYNSDNCMCYVKFDDFESFLNGLIENDDIDKNSLDIFLDKNHKSIKFIYFDTEPSDCDTIERYVGCIHGLTDSTSTSDEECAAEFDKLLEETKNRLRINK